MRIRLLCATIIVFLCLNLGAESSTYLVKKGDTLYGIAHAFGITVADLAKTNGIKESEKLLEGRKLVIPARPSASATPSASPEPSRAPSKKPLSQYTIKSGDTLFSIARAHGMDLDELLTLNGLKRNSVIKTGKKISVYAPEPKASSEPKISQKSPTPSPSKRVATEVSWPVAGKMDYMDGILHGVTIIAKKGDPVRAVANGTVVQATSFRGYSGVIFVERADKMIYVYGGNDSLLVKKGDKVQAGAKLGYLGLDSKTGEATLSFMVFQNGKAIDPSTCPRD